MKNQGVITIREAMQRAKDEFRSPENFDEACARIKNEKALMKKLQNNQRKSVKSADKKP